MDKLNQWTIDNKAFKKYFEKTGIRLTDEPLDLLPPEIKEQSGKLYRWSRSQPRKAIPELRELVKNYPKIASLKNYLYTCYVQTKQFRKADKLLKETIEKHPNYIFAIGNKILNIHDPKKLEKHAHLLGVPRDIRTLRPEQEVFHVTEFINYQMTAGHLEALTGDEDAALERLESLIEIRAEESTLERLATQIAVSRMAKFTERLDKKNKKRISVKSVQKVKLKPTKEPPVLENPDLEIFFTCGIEQLRPAQMAKLSSLPRASLIRDLENILEDSIRRFDYFGSIDYQDDTHEFIIHALYFLGALKSEGSLQKVLNLLRMGEGFTDSWFGDMTMDFLYPTLYALGENQLSVLKDYVLEEDLYAYDRFIIPETVAQVALHQPERRQEVVDWFREVYDTLLQQPKNKRLIDSDFIGLSIGGVLDFRGVELLPQVETMYAKGWIPDDIQGNLKEIIKQLKEALNPSELKPLPLNLEEYYSKEYERRRAAPSPLPEDTKTRLDKMMNSKAGKMVSDLFAKALAKATGQPYEGDNDSRDYLDYEDDFSYAQPTSPIVRNSPKVGRNDPCPCGSRKKYKRCCLRKG